MSLVLETAEGLLRQIVGYAYAPPKAGTTSYRPADTVMGQLPARVDLRPYMTAVEDQRGLSSCVANAVAGAYEYLVKRHWGDESYDVSRLYIYYNGREHSGEAIEDDGVRIHDAIESLGEVGACSEETWPYREDLVNERPSEAAFQEGARFLVEDVALVETDETTWKQALAEGNPIIFGLRLYKSFDRHPQRGLVPRPTDTETSRDTHSGHAMLAVGYSDVDRVFIVRNSWGTQWGDGGYCYIPYDYLMDERFNFGDSWLIRRLEHFEVDHENTWFHDDASILTEFDSELARMEPAAYQALLDDLGDIALETRIALIQLCVVGAEGDISQPELESISRYLEHIFSNVGSVYDPLRVLQRAQELLVDESVVTESIEVLGRHFSPSALASMVNEMAASARTDGLHEEEESFLFGLVQAWQVEPHQVDPDIDGEVEGGDGGDPPEPEYWGTPDPPEPEPQPEYWSTPDPPEPEEEPPVDHGYTSEEEYFAVDSFEAEDGGDATEETGGWGDADPTEETDSFAATDDGASVLDELDDALESFEDELDSLYDE